MSKESVIYELLSYKIKIALDNIYADAFVSKQLIESLAILDILIKSEKDQK